MTIHICHRNNEHTEKKMQRIFADSVSADKIITKSIMEVL